MVLTSEGESAAKPNMDDKDQLPSNGMLMYIYHPPV